MDPLTAIVVAIILGWGWTEVTDVDTCEIEVKVNEQFKVTDDYHQDFCNKVLSADGDDVSYDKETNTIIVKG